MAPKNKQQNFSFHFGVDILAFKSPIHSQKYHIKLLMSCMLISFTSWAASTNRSDTSTSSCPRPGRKVHLIGGSGEIFFVNQSNFFLINNADRHPSSRNTHQEYSFHLYCGGTSPTKHPISTILCNYAPASGKSRSVCPNASQSWFKHLDSLHIYSIGAAIRKDDEWNSLDGPKWRHTLTSVQIQCTVRWNYARWGQIWTYKKKKNRL